MSNGTYNIYICGVGGQGIIKTSVVIGEAAMAQGYDVAMSEIHGMSQRGGSVSTELRIGDYKSSIVENHKAFWLLVISSGISHETDRRIGPRGSHHASGLTSCRVVISWFPRGMSIPC